MKEKFLLFSVVASLSLQAQKNATLFAVTDQTKGGYNWSAIRQVSNSGNALIMSNQVNSGMVIDAARQQKKADFSPGGANYKDQPLFSGVAALAYDKVHDRLYFATMFTEQLRYINLGTNQPDRYYAAGDIADAIHSRQKGYVLDNNNQGPVVTRLVIGADGYGYGISNDGVSFFRFTTGSKTQIEELGALVDAPQNGSISVHNQCSSWGGDLVASARGELYLFTMQQHVFRIEPSTKVATYLGKLKGLDSKFTVNGAAVDENGEIILSTAAYAGSRGVIKDINTLTATEEKGDDMYNCSDLASGNSLHEVKIAAAPTPPVRTAVSRISVYPNPVTNGSALLNFNTMSPGRYTIDVLSGSGNTMLRQTAQISSEGQQVKVNTNGLAKGLYVVKVIDANRKEVSTTKLVVQ